MRVLLINHFPLDGSGSGTYIKNIAQQLIKLGHEACIIMPENIEVKSKGIRLHPVYFTGEEKIKGALDFNFPCFTTHPRSDTTFDMLSEKELKEYIAAFDDALKEEIEKFKPDIIHAQHIWILSFLAVKYNVPCVITSHGTDLMGYDNWPQFREYADIAANRCKMVISISKDNDDYTKKIFPVVKDKTVLLKNGYNDLIFYPQNFDKNEIMNKYGIKYDGEQIVLFAGKLTGFKGVDTLLFAAKQYEQNPENKLITLIAGSGKDGKKLRELAAELQLKKTHFLGNRSQEQLAELYNIADVFAMPSRREPFGLVALESMACGTAVVATNQGGLPDFVNEQVGHLININDADALCSAILEEISAEKFDPKRREYIAKYAKENYSQSVVISELIDIYESLIKENVTNEKIRNNSDILVKA